MEIRPYVTIRIPDKIAEFIKKNNWNVNGIFEYGLYVLSKEYPPTLKMLCEKFKIDLEKAKQKYMEILEARLKSGKMIYEKTISSVVVYLLGNGKITQEEIARAGGSTPPTIRAFINELGEL